MNIHTFTRKQKSNQRQFITAVCLIVIWGGLVLTTTARSEPNHTTTQETKHYER